MSRRINGDRGSASTSAATAAAVPVNRERGARSAAKALIERVGALSDRHLSTVTERLMWELERRGLGCPCAGCDQ